MRRTLVIALLLALAGVSRAQPVPEAVARWMADQRAAHRGVVSVRLTERSEYRSEAASGTRAFRIEAEIGFGRDPVAIERRVTKLEMNGRPIPVEPHGMPRNGPRNDPQRESDRLIRPLMVLESMRPGGEPEFDDIDGRPSIRVAMVAREPDDAIPRLSAWFDRETAALLQVRAFIGGRAGTALDVLVRYDRVDGLDLPVRRRTEGSVTFRRREREFSTLIDTRSEFLDTRVERG